MSSNEQDASPPIELKPSLLGTKVHWDEVYARELENNAHDIEDEGTIWFDENGAEEAVTTLLDSFVDRGLLYKTGTKASRILDLGCGNGHMLFTLREGDGEDEDSAWSGQMVGIDYSASSISLAQQIAGQRQLEAGIAFHVWDLLSEQHGVWLDNGFDLILDKGTFDAISLMPQTASEQHSCEVYCKRLSSLMRHNGIVVITSCNWTKTELLAWFARAPPASRLRLLDEAQYPSFTFGGQSGQSIVTLAFTRDTM